MEEIMDACNYVGVCRKDDIPAEDCSWLSPATFFSHKELIMETARAVIATSKVQRELP
jgi:hypothetical protein